jgi:hypothetical protein
MRGGATQSRGVTVSDQRDSDEAEIQFPEGLAFLKLAEEAAGRCATESDERFPSMGKACPECLRNLGTILSQMYRLGSCFERCQGGDHLIEYILGRTTATALSALSLLRQGYYDESLSLTRSIGETANLFMLFVKLPARLEEWKSSDTKSRLKKFSPIHVRLALEQAGVPMPLDKERYGRLSETATHISPRTRPQMHNVAGVPTLGALFQEMGALVALNELAWATGWAGLVGAKLMDLPGDEYPRIKALSIELLASVGGLTLQKSAEIRDQLSEAPTKH